MTSGRQFHIRRSGPGDLDRIMEIYEHARAFMSMHGNPGQWIDGYPSRDLIVSEIEALHSYVCGNADGDIVGTFCLIIGEDPTYRVIEQGRWLSDNPYGTYADAYFHNQLSTVLRQAQEERCLANPDKAYHNQIHANR